MIPMPYRREKAKLRTRSLTSTTTTAGGLELNPYLALILNKWKTNFHV
jgi:hypothetical protein